jgi:microcystin-dependent protein
MEPFIGQIMPVGFNFAPRGWAFCDGQLLAISQNQALFSLLGTVFGGDGRTTFSLPGLRGRSIVHPGQGAGLDNIRQGQKGGASTITLQTAHMPAHAHTGSMKLGGSPEEAGAGHFIGANQAIYTEDAGTGAINAGAVTTNNTGGNQAFSSRNPYLGIYVCIALVGVFPSRN